MCDGKYVKRKMCNKKYTRKGRAATAMRNQLEAMHKNQYDELMHCDLFKLT